MTLNLERQLTFYGAYHRNSVNIAIHMVCVPLILFSGFTLAANTGTLIPLPTYLTIPHLDLNLGTLAAFTWGGLYVLLEPVAGTILAFICLGAAAVTNTAVAENPTLTNQVALTVHIVCWLLQFVGHGAFEGRAPALLDNLTQAIFLAPLFVWLEFLFKFGYRRELQSRVSKAVQVEIAKFKERKAGAAKNGKAQ
ncbi:putative endoplasmic reticulum membrane protein C16E8.02 [Daldinia childiae]|uniref:putative endoplasmic reticulum membrane protein C16E8.02 n=1 Tax=Daldinia childiae TaxID=326645 RepID=UPI0014474C44|nr:putative endoplasmic reticulum membrane protein C16E8.02 [Daldinia childiae]KAF3059820.1 putative endoplasmic reticulum membrane protein C16E8.02 [Daldinia childiae]